jgi:hypothetical protein
VGEDERLEDTRRKMKKQRFYVLLKDEAGWEEGEGEEEEGIEEDGIAATDDRLYEKTPPWGRG